MKGLVWVALLLAICSALGFQEAVVKSVKQCAPGCTDRGNCNAETGDCECPWGYTGQACEVDRMAVCRQTPDDPGSCGTLWPKHCDCYQTCQRLYCGGRLLRVQYESVDSCTHELGEYVFNARCWMLRNPDSSIPSSSRLPLNVTSDTIWYEHYAREDRPHCMCRKGFNGTSCESEDSSEACWFSPTCGDRGHCRSGFCHCRQGFFGVGCHRSTAYQPTNPGTLPDLRPRSKLKIYMYDLPWEVAFPYEYNDGHFGRDKMYAAYEYFMTYFLQDHAVRTENPYEANLFYIPMLAYFYIANVRNPVPQVTLALDYVRTKWPFYNRTGGRDHFYFLTGDRGACSTPRWLQDSCIKLVHFGLQGEELPGTGVPNREYGCVQVKRDLVIPPINLFTDLVPSETQAYYKWLVSKKGYDSNRKLLFFFAGGVGQVPEYSGGVRQAIKGLLSSLTPKPEDVEFFEGRVHNYKELLQSSKFCIAPYGFGWGLRLIQAIEYGCIPLIIQDHVYQPFERPKDFLPYEEFSVRMGLVDIPYMIELLRSYTEAQLAQLRLGMAKYYQAFIWNREYGGLAYEWTLAGLERRLAHMNSEYYLHHHHHRRRRRALD
ncbi:acetylglucosaminyltransferase [Volvox carteri f. nagariensis]|uniref:Acetylglucosaminyltransferase n=1 Tax=Volvox carteri f. nagariensis TaxID=3068 RepID=D8UGB1_VOLCA|nr:acetylglucosaminyltransferase [Volvox carteri f. nagariensis]EFJ41257.1 acetylglucosaminyltransferase [Volvox carteri f. nagariensis]|eukprot:XP_002957708.1 acetylglucosaminyltransferase [Volvox carteri f. nagariensis]